MRRFDKKYNIQKANLLSEQRYVDLKNLIKESDNLTPGEKEIYNDIISGLDVLNEGSFAGVLDKVKGYVKKGVLTAGILTALLATPGITNAQSRAINKATDIGQVDSVGASVEIKVIGKSSDRNISNKKAKINVNKLVSILNVGTDYEIVSSNVVIEKGDTITSLNIKVYLTDEEIKILENAISQYDKVPFSIVSK